MSDWDKYNENAKYQFYIPDAAAEHLVESMKQEINQDILRTIGEEAMKDNVDFFCTKCQKICTGIDCECTHEKNVVEIHTLPDGSKVIYDEREALKYHPEIPTEEDIVGFKNIQNGKGVKMGEQLILFASGKGGKSIFND